MKNNPFVYALVRTTVLLVVILVAGTGVTESAGSSGFERIELPEPFGFWVTALPDGQVMTWWPAEKPDAADATGTTQLALARFSSDNGVIWTEPRTLFEFPRVEGEARYIGGADGVIICDNEGGVHIFGSLRNKTFSWETYEGELLVYHVVSKDNGKTWSKVEFVPTGYNYAGLLVESVEVSIQL
ncbi:MAG: glycoside hydrolase [Candidatus Hydrogenedentes bacterium]|nr:glycoside hydrolase [Candidatus Hydrogenedentota bacterium]